MLQGLYQRQLSGNPGDAIRAQLAEAGGFPKADEAYFDVLWAGVTTEYDPLVALLSPYLDRRLPTASRRSSARYSSSARGSFGTASKFRAAW